MLSHILSRGMIALGTQGWWSWLVWPFSLFSGKRCSWCDTEELCLAAKAHQAIVWSVGIWKWSLLGTPDTTPNSLSSQPPVSKRPAFQRCSFAGDNQSDPDPVSSNFRACQASCWYHSRCWWPIPYYIWLRQRGLESPRTTIFPTMSHQTD